MEKSKYKIIFKRVLYFLKFQATEELLLLYNSFSIRRLIK